LCSTFYFPIILLHTLSYNNDILLVSNDGASHDILCHDFSFFLSIWRQIRGHLEKLSTVLRTFCIVFIKVIVFHFYPKSWNSIGVLSLFIAKSCNSEKKDTTWRIKGYEDCRSMVLRRFLKIIQFWENSSQDPRHFKTEEC
jgi:hypothetical protein